MTTATRDLLETGLRNAHALERQAESVLEDQCNRLEKYPELQQRISRHAEETRNQAARLELCLEQLGTSASVAKDTALQMQGIMQGFMHAASSDEVLKDSFAAYAFENYEIAAYKALIVMAEAEGEERIAETCRDILREEQGMAAWLDDNLAHVVRSYLAKVTAGDEGRAVA